MSNRTFDHVEALRWGQFIETVYKMCASNPGELNPVQPLDFPPDWRLVANISVEPSVSRWHSKEHIGCMAHSEMEPSRMAIVFRGTSGGLEWLGDFEFWPVPFKEVDVSGKVEDGFARMFHSLKVHLPGSNTEQPFAAYLRKLRTSHLTVTGHSLGGALSTLTALVASFAGIDTQVMTFGSPMVGNRAFTTCYEQAVPNTFRVYNQPDIVPKLPSHELGYVQPDYGIVVNSLHDPMLQRSIAHYHEMDTYLRCIAKYPEQVNQTNEKVV